MLTSIELGWLSKGDGISLPKIEIDYEMNSCNGIYIPPDLYKPKSINERSIIQTADGREIDTEYGLILISGKKVLDEREYEIDIAHEYRHHWQLYNWGMDDQDEPDLFFRDWYKNAIRYFNFNLSEFDALDYSIKKCKKNIPEYYEFVWKTIREKRNLKNEWKLYSPNSIKFERCHHNFL